MHLCSSLIKLWCWAHNASPESSSYLLFLRFQLISCIWSGMCDIEGLNICLIYLVVWIYHLFILPLPKLLYCCGNVAHHCPWRFFVGLECSYHRCCRFFLRCNHLPVCAKLCIIYAFELRFYFSQALLLALKNLSLEYYI